MDTAPSVEITEIAQRQTKRKSFMQVMVCVGCCCGRPDRGKPDVPVDWLKAQWKAARLNPYVQLTISGCLGPCDLPNVVAILSPAGQQWIGQLNCQEHFEALVRWGRACGEAGHMVQLPEVLSQLTFRRFEARA
jgi:predicted metal-binding protein